MMFRDFDKSCDKTERRFLRLAVFLGIFGFLFELALFAAVIVGIIIAWKHFG